MRQALEDLIEAVEMAINAGDWKVDGACDPTLVLMRAKEALAQPEKWGASAVTHPEYIAEQKAKTQELRSMLAQPEQEPVAWMLEGWGPDCGPYFEIYRDDEMGWRNKKEWTPLYTTPPQRKPMTDDEIAELWLDIYGSTPSSGIHEDGLLPWRLARAIEAAHGIKG